MFAQKFIMIVGAIAMLIGAGLYFFYPLQQGCTTPFTAMGFEFCVTSPGSVALLVGAALLVIGFLGQQFLSSRQNR